MAAADADGFLLNRSAATPATCGVAMDVPLANPYLEATRQSVSDEHTDKTR
jgi:hypothetical protein